ncbi:MAG: hypothetical protein GXY83_40765 [Rhodopirellula sp.]|nr:hypothetical protein [Rhodopirellula sp.]
MKYRWNAFQIAAFICWGVGTLLIAIPAWKLYWSWKDSDGLILNGGQFVGSLLVGIVLLASGGTLHKIGSSREARQDKSH